MDIAIIDKTIKSLRKNHFDVFPAEDTQEAHELFFNRILPVLRPKTVSWGDSETMKATGVIETLRQDAEISIINTFGEGMSRTQKTHWRRQALLSDLFLTGTNALTQNGQLVNLDMIGNRVGGLTFGPEHVVLFIGINKITENLEEAMKRIRTIAAPRNAIRHQSFKTPCQKTGACMDCSSSDRLCNTWTITEKSYPAGRIKIILIREELGI